MKTVWRIALMLSLAGCVSSKTVPLPDGTSGYLVRCTSEGRCLFEAAEVCGTYEVISQDVTGSAIPGQLTEYQWLIRCTDEPETVPAASASQADEPTPAEPTTDETMTAAELIDTMSAAGLTMFTYRAFADCAGLYESMSVFLAQYDDTQAEAEKAHAGYLGARAVAAWLLAGDYYSRTGKEKPIHEFTEQVDSIAEVSAKHYLSRALKEGFTDALEQRMNECKALQSFQAEVVNKLWEDHKELADEDQ